MSGAKDRLPDFLLVGAARSGTSSLVSYLKQHPQIYLPERKEARFFVRDFYRTISREEPQRERLISSTVFEREDYAALFQGLRIPK